jgi:hypothetical protein
MIPALARFDPDQFVKSYFDISITYLLGQLKKDKERPIGIFGLIQHLMLSVRFLLLLEASFHHI